MRDVLRPAGAAVGDPGRDRARHDGRRAARGERPVSERRAGRDTGGARRGGDVVAGAARAGVAAAGRVGTIAVEVTVLGSGSAGNATLVSHAGVRVLLDVGFSYREVSRRLAEIDVDPGMIDAILITHAHGDHTRGLRVMAKRHGLPVYATPAIRGEWGGDDLADWRALAPGAALDLDGLCFVPFAVPHDAAETLAFRIETPEGAIGYATDVGALRPVLIERFRDCRLLVIESNHAAELLRVSPYARSTRERIAGDGGHLSNESLAAFVRDHLGAEVRCLVLAHLSRVNNLPELAEMTCREALQSRGRTDVEVVVARQDQVTPTIDLGAWTRSATSPAGPLRQTVLPFHVSCGAAARARRGEVRSR
ncbi:MAG: MBL fold metallo-hydrolase [Acidobacteria bacterium]|nr:MBL fold metallo-hydrolase [Acidobacteriota bacterium]